MLQLPVYLDNHATTRVDPRVVEAMLPYFSEVYGNAASSSHVFGLNAKKAVDQARKSIADSIGAGPKEIVFTGGASESNNLAIRGAAARHDSPSGHIITVTTEHPSVLESIKRLKLRGFAVTELPVAQAGSPDAGRITADQMAEAIRDDTFLVSVMLANNEIGVLQPVNRIGEICRERDVLLHTDASQAVGKIPVDVDRLNVDLMSFTAHKLYGPKGMGALYVRRRRRWVRLEPLVLGGGHEAGMRSGTVNVPGAVGMARAIELCLEEMPSESERLLGLRQRLYEGLSTAMPKLVLNGPLLTSTDQRLPGNLNVSFPGFDGETLLMSSSNVAASSGSACSSSKPEPSHVLRALGMSDELARASLRFGLGRFNTPEQVDYAIQAISDAINRLGGMQSLPMLPLV